MVCEGVGQVAAAAAAETEFICTNHPISYTHRMEAKIYSRIRIYT